MLRVIVVAVVATILLQGHLIGAVGLLGEFCSLDGTANCTVTNSYCQKNAACAQGVCKCKSGFVQFPGGNTDCSVDNIRLGSSCLDNVQCGAGTHCTFSCQCVTNFRPAADGINCLQGTKMLGANCTAAVSECGANAACSTTTNTCQCMNSEYKPMPDGYSCRRLTNGEVCVSEACDNQLDLHCISGTCQCASGHVWMQNVVIEPYPAVSQCFSLMSIFTRQYGEDCHDHTNFCGLSSVYRGCVNGLICEECPEDAGTCIRKCIMDSEQASVTTTTVATTTVATTTRATTLPPSSGHATTCWQTLIVTMLLLVKML